MSSSSSTTRTSGPVGSVARTVPIMTRSPRSARREDRRPQVAQLGAHAGMRGEVGLPRLGPLAGQRGPHRVEQRLDVGVRGQLVGGDVGPRSAVGPLLLTGGPQPGGEVGVRGGPLLPGGLALVGRPAGPGGSSAPRRRRGARPGSPPPGGRSSRPGPTVCPGRRRPGRRGRRRRGRPPRWRRQREGGCGCAWGAPFLRG